MCREDYFPSAATIRLAGVIILELIQLVVNLFCAAQLRLQRMQSVALIGFAISLTFA